MDKIHIDDDLNLDFVTVRQVGYGPERIRDQLVVLALQKFIKCGECLEEDYQSKKKNKALVRTQIKTRKMVI